MKDLKLSESTLCRKTDINWTRHP